jgi:hypothetical protein
MLSRRAATLTSNRPRVPVRRLHYIHVIAYSPARTEPKLARHWHSRQWTQKSFPAITTTRLAAFTQLCVRCVLTCVLLTEYRHQYDGSGIDIGFICQGQAGDTCDGLKRRYKRQEPEGVIALINRIEARVRGSSSIGRREFKEVPESMATRIQIGTRKILARDAV